MNRLTPCILLGASLIASPFASSAKALQAAPAVESPDTQALARGVESGVKHGPALDAVFVTHRGQELLGFRTRTSLLGEKRGTDPVHLEIAVQVPAAAQVTGASYFRDTELLDPWTVDGELVGFHPSQEVAARVEEVFMPAGPGMRWFGFRSDPLWSGLGEVQPLAVDEELFLSLSIADYPAPERVGPTRLYLFRGSDDPNGNRTITHWPAFEATQNATRAIGSWVWLVGGLALLGGLAWRGASRRSLAQRATAARPARSVA